MAKIAVLLPFAELVPLAQEQLANFPRLQPICVEHVATEEAGDRAAQLERQGCELIVARGIHATIIRQRVAIPLLDIKMTTTEMGLLVAQAKKMLGKAHPTIGVVSLRNMLEDMSRFDEIFEIRLVSCLVERVEDLPGALDQAMEQGADLIIGGSNICDLAQERGIPALFFQSGTESLRRIFTVANQLAYAIELEKKNSAETKAMLDNTFNGVMRVDGQGIILGVNYLMEEMIRRPLPEIVGHSVYQVLPHLEKRLLASVLEEGKDVYSALIEVAQVSMVMNIRPIYIDGRVDGAYLTFQEGRLIREMDSEMRREILMRGFVTTGTFENLVAESPAMASTVEQAARMAKLPAPILLTCEEGCEEEVFAHCIHRDSLCRSNGFVSVDCGVWNPETLDSMLFGEPYINERNPRQCMAELAQEGTLFLKNVEQLPSEIQYKVLQLINGRLMRNGMNSPVGANVRVIASTHTNLLSRVEKKEFSQELYYALNVMNLELPPLRHRQEDLLPLMEEYLEFWWKKYKRTVRLTQSAQQVIRNYDWPGNQAQLRRLCERIVLLGEKRLVDDQFVRTQIDQVHPVQLEEGEKILVYQDRKAIQIRQLLKKYNGSREKVAAAMGISKTTLWRYMKKNGIID